MAISAMPDRNAARPGQDWLTPDGFLRAVGVEDTFIPQPSRTTGRVLDEYQLTDHYRSWRTDLAPVAEIGIRAIRYGSTASAGWMNL
jgi:hypothetical protein